LRESTGIFPREFLQKRFSNTIAHTHSLTASRSLADVLEVKQKVVVICRMVVEGGNGDEMKRGQKGPYNNIKSSA